MSSNFNAAEAGAGLPDPFKILEYPEELTLMSKYMNEVQAKQFKQKQSFGSFLKKGLNLTVLDQAMDPLPASSNIIDSGIRRLTPQPGAA